LGHAADSPTSPADKMARGRRGMKPWPVARTVRGARVEPVRDISGRSPPQSGLLGATESVCFLKNWRCSFLRDQEFGNSKAIIPGSSLMAIIEVLPRTTVEKISGRAFTRGRVHCVAERMSEHENTCGIICSHRFPGARRLRPRPAPEPDGYAFARSDDNRIHRETGLQTKLALTQENNSKRSYIRPERAARYIQSINQEKNPLIAHAHKSRSDAWLPSGGRVPESRSAASVGGSECPAHLRRPPEQT
jgi:hypothetical protein